MPSRNVTIPKETDAGKVRTFQRTAIEADSVSDEAAREIAESIANEELSSVYGVVSNKLTKKWCQLVSIGVKSYQIVITHKRKKPFKY